MSLRAKAALCYLIALSDALQSAWASDVVLAALGAGMILVGFGFEKLWRSQP